MTSPCLSSFAFEARKTCFIIHPAWQAYFSPPCTPSTAAALPPPFLAKLSTNWFFLFHPPPPAPPPSILMLLGCGKYLFTLIDDGADGSFMSVRTQTVFVPPMSPNINHRWEKCGPDCKIRPIKPQRPDSFSYSRKRGEENIHQTPIVWPVMECLCILRCVLRAVGAQTHCFKETNGTFFPTDDWNTRSGSGLRLEFDPEVQKSPGGGF